MEWGVTATPPGSTGQSQRPGPERLITYGRAISVSQYYYVLLILTLEIKGEESGFNGLD